MNDNDIITLAPNVTIKYIDNILVGGKNYYKYEAKVNDKQKNLYLNEKIGNDSKQKNAVYNFILNNENNDSTDIFLDLDIKDKANSTDFGGNGGDVSVQKSRNQNPKLSENWADYIDNALTSIRNTSNCSIGVIENFFNKESSISGKYKYIDDNMAESKNLYNKMLNSGKGGSGDLSGMVTNYRDTFNDIAYGILEMYDAAQTEAINNDELKMMDDKSKEYFGTESFNNEFKDILSNSKLELKKTNNNFLFKDMFKEIGALQAKYSVASLSENESIFKSISNSIDDNIDEDMKGKVDELVKFMAGFLGISELEARKAIKENPIEMANQLYDAQMSIAENVKNGGSGYDAPEISTSFWKFKDAFYSTDTGKEALFNRFLNSDSNAEGEFPKNITPYDEKNSIAYTNYITYCMQIGKLNWLMDSCKEFPVVIDKINNNDVFTVPEEVTDTNTLSYIAKNIEDYNVAPFGYVKKGDKWYQVNYNKRGQDMLYYMDYHCGENSGNNGDDRVITAFSNQGRVDSVERNYKGLWIDSHLNGDYDKNSSEYKSAERDYYVLNGVIEDKKRYNELTESGELSFKDLVKYSGLSDSEKDKLTDINYINEHKDEIKETMDLSEKQLYNFSVSLSTDGINSGDPVLDARLAASRIALSTISSAVTQFGGGLFKFFENVGDAANTALHSDFVLGSVEYDYTDWDGTSEPNAKFDLTKEFKEFRDSTWKDFYETEKYNEEFSSFKDSVVGLRQLESKLYNDYYQFDGNTDGYYYVNGKIYKSVDEIPNYVKENAFADLFKQNKLKEWDLKDTSSSNYYLAAFKEGIREGGNFTRFDNLSDKVVENAKIQFKAQEEVEVDKTGEWMESNIYNTDFYKNMEDYSFVKKDNILGMMFNQVGNMAVPIAISMIPGMFGASASALGTAVASSAQVFQGLSSAALFTSAFGGAAEEAFISGASYNEALKYATLSATTELAIEHVFSGIGGYGEGWLDDALEYLPNKFFASKGLDTNLTAQTLKTLITGGLGEAVEEVTTDFVTPLWQSMTYINDKTYYDVLNENVSLGSLAQTALVSFLSSMIFKGVEINQQTSAFNKNFTNLQNRISSVSNLNLDSNVLETQAKKVLAQYVGGIIENEGVIKSGLLEQLIKNASNQLVSDPKSREQLSKLQDELVSFKNQEVTIGEGKNSINVTGSELLKLEDYSGFDGKYTIEDGKIKFETEEIQSRFNSSILDLAQKQTDSYNSSLKELVMEFQNSKGSVNANNKVNNLQEAISTIIEYDNNKFDTNDLVFFEYNGEILLIPKSIATATTTKLSIEEGKISFKKDMNNDKFIGKLYDKAIGLCNEQIRKNTYDINKITNKGLVNKAIDIIKPSLENSTPLTFITGITQTENDNLTKIDVETTINGEQKNISVYIDGKTDSSVYKQDNKLTELIQKTIMNKGNLDLNNIYLGELVYDSKTGEFNSIQNGSNMLYVQTLELETSKSSRNIGQLQNVINSLTKINGNLESLEIVTIQKEGKNVLISKSLLDEITSKYKIVDGKVEFTKDMSVDKFISAVYDKAINLNNQTILGIQNTNIKNSTYVDADGMDLYRLEVETIIDGKTRTVNVYVDGNTDISSIKDSSKISEKLYQLITQNKNSENIYAGNIKYNEKTGVIDATYNEANKLYVDSISKISETTVQNETPINEEVNEDNNEIKKGIKYEYNIEEDGKESYEYTIEEVKDDDSVAKPTKNVEVKENITNVDNDSVITNVAGAASVGVTAGATSQAIYQNNAEVTTQNAKSQTKGKNVQSNIKNKENIHVETNNNHVISISEIKSQVNSYIDSIKTECEKYIEMHKNDENFELRFEQFKRDKIIEFNDKLSEVKKIIIDSNSAELNVINSKIDSLSENDSMRNELISKRDEIMTKQQQEISDIETSANQKLQKVFSELNIELNAEPLILSKDFVSTLTTEQKDFLTQVSSEQGLIEYLQNNPLTKVDLLERSELANTDNKYVNKLIQLISENQGTTKQIYNVMDVVKNNSTPILVESAYKGDTHTLSTNEVLDFMKTGKVDTKYSYSDYVKATNTLMNDIASQNASIDINGDVFNGISMYNEISGYLDGSSNFTALYNLNIIEKCNKFYEFISKNNISLDSAVMEKLDFISKLEENKTIANLNDYFNGKSPIVMDKYIRVYGREISTQSLIDLVEMKSPNYLILLRDYKISSIPNSERFLITSAIDKLMSSNTDLAEYYKSNYEKFNNLYQNKYVLKNSYILVPSTIGEYPTKYIDHILHNPYAISIYDGEERHQIISTVNAFAKYLDENNLSSYYSSSKLDFLNRKVVDIDSSVSYTTELLKMFDTNGESFGANQGAVRELIIRLKMNDAVQSIFGNKIETKDFMETLNNMNFTEEQFKNALLTVNANNLLPLGDIEMLNTLIEQVVDNYPGMSKKDALQFLYLLESKEAGGRGICNYASMVNLIFDKYKNNIDLFEKHFGYPMYLTINGKEQLNTTRLLVDMYSTINEGLLVTRENGTYKVATSSKVYRNLTRDFYGDISKENFERFLTKKGIKLNINEKFTYSTVDPDNMFHYEEIITSVRDSLAKGEHVHLTSMNFSLYNLDGSIFNYDIEPHIMSVVGINEDGKLLVDSWGKKLLFDLREELARLTNDDLSLDALKIKHYTTIVSYDISLDNNSNHSTSLDIKTDVNKERNTYNGSYTEVFDEPSSSIKSNVTSSVITKEDLEFIDEGFETRDAEAPMTSAQSVQSDVHSDVSNIINIDGVDITVETLKQLQTQSNLENALKTGEYAGVRVEKALVELSKLDGVTLDSKLQELVKISETLRQDEIIFNIEDVYSNGGTANIINIDVYNEFMKTNLNSSISLDNLYKIINSNGDIYKLISNDTIIKNVSNESIKESLSYLVSISNRYNYENKVTREAQYLLNLLEDNYTTEELYDAFAIAHTEFNTPDVYYECSNYIKTMDVDSAVKLLESKGYTTLDITDAFLNLAIRMDSQGLSKKYYYKAFDYLVENGMDEKEAATIIRDKYRTLINRRGTRVVTTTPNGVKIKIVNNISTNNKLFTIEKIESMIKQAEKYYSKTGLKEIVIFDSFAPHNIYSEKVQYEDYVKTHNNRRFVAAASATKSSIILWEDFDKLDSIVHEYGHTIDKHIKLVNKLATDFSSSSTWLEAIQKDTAITSKRVSEYAYASNGEDFAEFLKHFNRNPLEVARKYPNRYKAASKYLNLDIDSNIIERYLDSKKFFIAGIEDLSNLLTEDGSMLEFIKQYVFENLKGDNSIAKTVISNLDAVYESRMEIIEDYGVYSLFMDIREQERIGSHEFIKIMRDYLDGKDISSKIKDSRNLEIIELLEKEEIQEWYEEELNEMTAETEKISVSDEDFEKLLNSISNDSESNSSSDTNVIEESETMDFPIQDIPTTEDLGPYKVVQKYDHDDLIISEELVEKFSQRTIDAFISIYEYIPNLGQYIGKMDISGKTKLLDIINSLNVDIDSNSSLKQLKNLIEQLDGRHVFNLDDLSNDSKLVMLPKELYTQYGEQIDYLHKICSREYSLKSFIENPDLKILKELKDGLFEDVNFDPNTYYLIQKLYDASNVLLEDKVIVNTKNFVSKKGTELIVVDKETFELYKEELKQFDYITEDVYNLKNFILNSSDVEILKLKNLFDEVNLETSDEFINKVKNIIYELSNGKTIVNIREYNWIENPIIMSKDIYNSNKEIVDNVVESIEYNSTLIKYLESIDVDSATKLRELIDNGDLVINTKNGEILNKLINDIASGNKIVNLNDVVYRDAKPLIINGEVYNTYVNQKPSLCIAIDVIYDIFDSKDLIYRLLSNKTILSNVSNENVINSLKLYLEIANNKGYSDSVINEIKYYLDVMSDTPQFISKIFNGCNVRVLEMLINNPTKINSYTSFEKEGILKAVKEYSEFIRNNYPERYLNYVDNINVLTRNVPKIDSSIAIETELYKMFENIGKIFGADQGAVRELLTRLKMNDVVQFLCGNKIEGNNFMDILNNMDFSEEQFKNALLEVNKENNSFLTDENTFDSLKDQVMKNYPGMSEKDATQFLYLMEAYKDSEGICNYAATVNLIFNKYKNNPKLFEEHFGYPMYVTVGGKNELNTTMLLVDMYSIINDGGLVTNENGIYKVNTSNENYLNLSDNGKLNMEYFQKFLDRKGIKFNIEETYVYQSEPRTIPNSTDMMHYEEVITNIHDCLARGEHVDISAHGFNLYKPDGTIIAKDVGGHIMTVVGITSDGNLIVDSWGRKLIFNLKEQMSNLGDVYEIEEKFGIERRRRVNIVSYDISFDNIINISTSSNIDANINNSTNTQTSGESINSPKSSVISTIDIDTDLDIIDVSTDIRNVDSLMSRSDLSQKGYESDGNADIKHDSEVVDVNDEVNKILKWESHLEKFIKSKDTSLARSISNLIKSGNVDLSSPIGIKLKQIVDAVADNGHLINLDAFVYGTESPIIVNNEVYIEYNKINPGKSIKELYDLVKKNSLYEKLSSNEKDTYMKSIDTLLGLSNDKNALINELEVISKALKEDSNNAFDIISRYHMEAKLPRGYSEYSDLLKSGLSINEAISQLESSGYKFKDISYIVMSAATMTYNDDIIQKSYYDLFEYLKVKFMEENLIYTKDEQKLIEHGEKRAAETIRDQYQELIDTRGTRIIDVTESGVVIRVVNNCSSSYALTKLEVIKAEIANLENMFGKSKLNEILIYDTFSPENLYNEKVEYKNYVETYKKRFIAAATATSTRINIWDSFKDINTISHEYGHTIDFGVLGTDSKHFSKTEKWETAKKKDGNSISEYGNAKIEEDFAEFIKYYYKNPIEVALKYPNRYLAIKDNLKLKIDIDTVNKYIENKNCVLLFREISQVLGNDSLDIIKKFVMNSNIDTKNNIIVDSILKALNSKYTNRTDILKDMSTDSILNKISIINGFTDIQWIDILGKYLNGESIVGYLSEEDIKLIELLNIEEVKKTYNENLEIYNYSFLSNEESTDAISTSSNDGKSTYNDSLIKDADVDMAFPKKSIFSKKIETVSVSDIPRVFRNMNTTDIISILEGKTTLKNDENFINNKKSIIRFVKYLSENNIKLSLNERASTIIENLRNGDFKLNILNFSDVLNGDTPIYGPSSISLDRIKISTDDVMNYLENKKNEISSIITSDTPNEDARELLNAIDELGSKNDIIYDKYRKSIKLIERIERSYIYRSYDSYYLLPKSFNGIDTSNILNSDLTSLVSYINSLSNADKKSYRVALDEFGKYIYKSNTRLSKQDLSRVNKLYDVINTKKFSTNTIIKSKIYDSFEMSYRNNGEFGSNQGKVREVIEKLGITDVIQNLFSERVERSKFLQTLSEFNISESDFINALNIKNQSIIMNSVFIDGDINCELFNSLIDQVKMNYPNMSTMDAVRFLYLIETKEAGGPGICNNPILVNMIFDRYVGKENIFERDFGYPMYIKANNGKKVLNEARLLVDIFSTLNDGVLVHNVNGKYIIQTTSVNYVRAYDLNGLRVDAVEKFLNKKGININVFKSYFFNSNEELMHYDYLMEQIKSELSKGNYVIFGGKGFDMDVENFEFREDCDAHGMTIVGIDTTGELILDSWGMKARIDLKKELSRLNTMFKDRSNNMTERIFTISSYSIN